MPLSLIPYKFASVLSYLDLQDGQVDFVKVSVFLPLEWMVVTSAICESVQL